MFELFIDFKFSLPVAVLCSCSVIFFKFFLVFNHLHCSLISSLFNHMSFWFGLVCLSHCLFSFSADRVRDFSQELMQELIIPIEQHPLKRVNDL